VRNKGGKRKREMGRRKERKDGEEISVR